jgi:ABC-2 type transport system permease protein
MNQLMNLLGVRAIYMFEMGRTWRTLFQSIASPVLSTALYFVVFGSAIGSRMQAIDGIPYAAFIVPGLILLTVLTESVSNASFGIYLPRFTGTIYELLSAPVSSLEVIVGFVGAAATKSIVLGLIIFFTARLFVTIELAHPLWALGFLALISVTFALFGFILGLWADGFEKLQIVPMMIISPLTFLGGTFYSIDMLPPFWRNVALFNPIVYLVDGFRWTFFGIAALGPGISFGMTLTMLLVCVGIVMWIFKTGYRLRT